MLLIALVQWGSYLPFHVLSVVWINLGNVQTSGTMNWHPKHTKIYIWLLAVAEKQHFKNTLFFLSCFLYHALSSISLCSLQHWHTALKSMGSYGTIMEKHIMCPRDQLLSCWWHHKSKFLQARVLCSFTHPSWWISAVLGIAHKIKICMQIERGYSNTSSIHGMGKACNEMENLQKQIEMSKNKMQREKQ